jgi:hypothetical protein
MDDGDYVIKVINVVKSDNRVLIEIIENHGKGKRPLIKYVDEVEKELIDAYYKKLENGRISVRIKDNTIIKTL